MVGPPRPGQPLTLLYPLERQAKEVDPCGWLFPESRQAGRTHTGQDLIVPAGTAILAAQMGTVVLDHGRGWRTLYSHLLDIAVMPGEAVSAGQAIGHVGQSGRATTPHLQFELREQQRGEGAERAPERTEGMAEGDRHSHAA